MTEEEKEAIETMKRWIEYEKQNKDKINKANELIEIQETVLNLIQKQEKTINKLKRHNKELLRKLRNRVKEVKKLTKYSFYKKEFATLNKKLKEKNKQIDLMAKEIKERNYNFTNKNIKEIKQYFERQAAQEGDKDA